MANFYKKSNQLGRSMIEMLGVLAIIGVLSVAGIAAYSKAMSKWKINKAIDQISMIIANVQTLFSNTNDYTALNEKAYSLGIFPDDMKKESESAVYNVFGLETHVWGNNNWWYIDYSISSRDACIALLTQEWGADNVRNLQVGANDDFMFYKTPVSISEAGNACKKVGQMYNNFEDGDVYFEIDFN